VGLFYFCKRLPNGSGAKIYSAITPLPLVRPFGLLLNPMRSVRLFLLFAAGLSFLPTPRAQAIEHRYLNWFTYFAQYRLSKHWSIHVDAQFRTDGKVHQTQQSLLRAGLQYLLSANTNLTLGYALIGTYSAAANGYFGEHRLWQQYLHTSSLGTGVLMTHRLRLEERWVGSTDGSGGRRNGFRLRYFNRTIINLSKRETAWARPYLALQNELFINSASPDINPHTFDQNRLLIAVGVLNNRHTRLELGYMNQYLNPPGRVDIANHILHFSLLQTLNFTATEF
jgi:hypothetical protein